MEFRSKLRLSLAAPLAAVAIAGLAAGCGGDDGGGSETPAPTEPVIKSENPTTNTTGPASAGDKGGPAPDDKISDRPGGPNDKGEKSGEKDQEQPVGGSGDISAKPQPKPVKP